ncbi:MAG TPA: hypothetical protein VGO45_02500, partial [Bacteroidia bacterium]|nr:hypothetical protein [Bacteroidia bacterium]
MIAILFSPIGILIRSKSVHEAALCAGSFVNGGEKASTSALKAATGTPDDTTGVLKAAIRVLKSANEV